ncbi:hypothetical protein PS907_04126 [Pseudomonas fluorescens]|nr:hypothetical protein PS907_04126 [Pseudomonas fluorescens]
MPEGAISAVAKLNCGSCRAPARLRRRRHCWHFHRLAHRFRSLAKARQLPQGIGCAGWGWVVPEGAISAVAKLNCGSCRAPARLRRRRHCWHFHRLAHRFRSLAKARQLPQGIGCAGWGWVVPEGAISAVAKLNCGSCRAPARLRRRRHCWHFHRLAHRFRSLAKARQLPQGIGCAGWGWVVPEGAISAVAKLNCGSCRAPARLRRRRHCWHFHRLAHRFRSLAGARQLPQGIGCAGWGWVMPASAIGAVAKFNCGSCRAPARLRRRRHCWQFRRLIHRFRSLAKARQLPQGIGCAGWGWVMPASAIGAVAKLNCGSCRAPARQRRRRLSWPFHRLRHRFRSLAKARQLPQGLTATATAPRLFPPCPRRAGKSSMSPAAPTRQPTPAAPLQSGKTPVTGYCPWY